MERNSSESTKALAKALIQVQRQLQPAAKDARNPFCGNNYASLNSVMDTCRAALLTNGILLTQIPVPSDGSHMSLETRLTHAESGEWISGTMVMPLAKNDPQTFGSAITYARRYSLSAMLGIVTEDDDDAEQAMPRQPERPNKTPSPLPPLEGVEYERVDSNGRQFIVAKGRTMDHRDRLRSTGFRWSPDKKAWWKPAS